MKTKIVIAYEPESSQTTRLTVSDYASLFKEIPLRQLDQFFSVIQSDLDLLGNDQRRDLLAKYLK